MNKHIEQGIIVKTDNVRVVKKHLNSGAAINRHDHPGFTVIFTLVVGKLEVTIDENNFILEPGTIVEFDGESFISANAVKDSQIQVTLIKK